MNRINLYVKIEIEYLDELRREPLPMNYSLTWKFGDCPNFEMYMNNLMNTIIFGERNPRDIKVVKIKKVDVCPLEDKDHESVSQIKDFCKEQNIALKFM